MSDDVVAVERSNLSFDVYEPSVKEKAIKIFEEFGTELIETPIADLKEMANMQCQGGGGKSLFGRIWDKHHFMPTANILRAIDKNQFPCLPCIISVLDQI